MSKILIIDDEKDIRELFREFLEREGFEVVEADNGVSGLAMFKKEHADLVITDIIMPEKEGLIRRDFLEYAKKFGANEVLTKPLKLSALLETVGNLIGEPERT